MNEVINAILTRRSVRSFKDRQIRREDLDVILECTRHAALLVQAAAEHLPFMDAAFDSVLHMGGINFFTDKAQALCEMVKVAKPGSKIVVVDETDEFTRKHQKTPIAGSFYRDQQPLAVAPPGHLPPGMREVQVKTIAGGELYCLTFRCPS